MTAAWFALNMMQQNWNREDDERRREEYESQLERPIRYTTLEPPGASGGFFYDYETEPKPARSDMNKYKVYLKSGTVLTIAAEGVYTYNGGLFFHNGDNSVEEGSFEIIALFQEWEGYQWLKPAPTKGQEKSGS